MSQLVFSRPWSPEEVALMPVKGWTCYRGKGEQVKSKPPTPMSFCRLPAEVQPSVPP